MTTRDGFTRLVDTWLAEEGVQSTPDYFDEVLERTSSTGQRPAWLSPGRWLPVDTTVNPRAYSLPPAARYALIAALVIVLAVAALVLYAGTQRHRVPAPFGPAANGRIYFDADGTVVTANGDGTDRRTIDLGGNASAPFLSPDGAKFAFVAADPTVVAGGSVMVADADGSHPRKVSGDLRLDIDPTNNPSWSPDSSNLVFGAYHEGYDELFVASADGSSVRPLGSRDTYSRSNPEWSPSGDWIVYTAWTGMASSVIGVIKPDGTGERTLSASAGAGDGFRGWQLWAPDNSNRILYGIGATPDTLGDAMATMDVDTGVETVVSDVPGVAEHRGAWSPDATRIAFHLGDSIAVVNADGTGLVRLPDSLGAGPIGWSPDGAWIYGKSPDDLSVLAIDPAGNRPPVAIKVDGTEAGVFSWQRVAP